jgi:hypothetical protein
MGWVVSTKPRALYPLEYPDTNCIGGWLGRRTSLDGCRKSRSDRDSNLNLPARKESLHRPRYPGPHTALNMGSAAHRASHSIDGGSFAEVNAADM